VGNVYEVTGSTVTKYYYAGSQRVAMRKGASLYFLLGDHLGSTSIITNGNGGLYSEMRYKPWGETRYSSGTTPTNYTYTGQYSNMGDFGLMFYNARWYDPSIGRFAQADSIIPGGVQGLDRYAYTNNSPINYTDPSGHNPECGPDGIYCGGGKWVHAQYPDKVDKSLLSDHVYITGVSGKMMYDFYLSVWLSTSNGHLTIKYFTQMIISHEFMPYQDSRGNLLIDQDYQADLQSAMIYSYWQLQSRGSTYETSESILNWISSFASAGFAYVDGTLSATRAIGYAGQVLNNVYATNGLDRIDPTAPSLIGNASMYPLNTISAASQGIANNQFINSWGNPGDDTAYIVSLCQDAYFKGDTVYVKNQC